MTGPLLSLSVVGSVSGFGGIDISSSPSVMISSVVLLGFGVVTLVGIGFGLGGDVIGGGGGSNSLIPPLLSWFGQASLTTLLLENEYKHGKSLSVMKLT